MTTIFSDAPRISDAAKNVRDLGRFPYIRNNERRMGGRRDGIGGPTVAWLDRHANGGANP